jgi:hypothetical protein
VRMDRDKRIALVSVVLAFSACGACRQASVASTATPPCPWTVTGIREATAADSVTAKRLGLFIEHDEVLRVPGPGGLIAIVEIDSLHRSHIVLEDPATGDRRRLISGSRPRWSPDGTMIACTVWKSRQVPWALCVVDVRTGKRLDPDLGCLATEMEWSPDGSAIAIGGRLPRRPVSVLSWVSIPRGDSRMLDTLPVFAGYEELAWSPDSRALIVTRVTATDHYEEPIASDLWIFEADGLRCPLTETSDVMETRPLWIDSNRILYMTTRGLSSAEQAAQLRVLAITRAGKH